MANILPSQLPAAPTVTSTAAIIVDSGSIVEKATPAQIVNAAAPVASEAEALAGTENTKRMTALRVRQALGELLTPFVTLARLAASGGSALMGFLQAGTGAVSRTGQSKMRDIISVKDFGATGDGTTNDAAAIQAAITRAEAVGGYVYLPAGTYRITTGLTIDHAKAGMWFDGAKIDASDMTTGAALSIQGSVSPPFFQAQYGMYNVWIEGPGSDSDVDGLLFDTPDGVAGASSHFSLYSGNVYYFRAGVHLANHAYAINLNGLDVFGCDYGLYAPAGSEDTGENIAWTAGVIYGCLRPVYLAVPSMEVYFNGTSIDYNEPTGPIMEVIDSRVFFSGHIEDDTYIAIPFVVSGNGAGFHFDRVRMFLRDGPDHVMTHLFNIGSGSQVVIGDVFFHNISTTSRQWYTGDGSFDIVGRVSTYGVGSNARIPTIPNVDNGRMIDPTFAQASILDNVWVTGGTVSDRFTSTNGTVETDATGLKITKIGAAAAAFGVLIAVPTTNQEAVGALLAYSKPSGMEAATPVVVTLTYAAIRDGAVPNAIGTTNVAATNLTFATGAIAETELAFQGGVIAWAPAWATHTIVGIDFTNASAGVFHINYLQMDRTA